MDLHTVSLTICQRSMYLNDLSAVNLSPHFIDFSQCISLIISAVDLNDLSVVGIQVINHVVDLSTLFLVNLASVSLSVDLSLPIYLVSALPYLHRLMSLIIITHSHYYDIIETVK